MHSLRLDAWGMETNEDDVKGRKPLNAFGEFVDKPLGNGKPGSSAETYQHPHGQKKLKLKLSSEAPLMSFSALPLLPQHLLSSLFQHNFAGTLLFQLFVSRSYGPPPASSSPPPGHPFFSSFLIN